MKNLSGKIEAISESPSIKLSSLVAQLRLAGEKVIGLHIGEPDFETPPEIIDACEKALRSGKTRYSLVAGTKALRGALSQKLRDFNCIEVDPSEVIVGSGSKHILYSTFQVLLNPGDEVLVPIPYWVSIPESIKLAGGVPVFVASKPNHQLDFEAIRRAITPKTKAIHINTPNNPSGAVYGRESLMALGQLCIEHDLYIVSDEAYETFTFGTHEHVSIASLSPQIFERTLSAYTFSKSSCMTGFRLGYAAGPGNLITLIEKLHSHLNGHIPEFVQDAGLAALTMDQNIFKAMSRTMEERALHMQNVFGDIFPLEAPQGALYHFANVSSLLGEKYRSSEALATHILKEAKVATLPGEFFGIKNHLRLCFAADNADVVEAAERIRKIL